MMYENDLKEESERAADAEPLSRRALAAAVRAAMSTGSHSGENGGA